MIVAFLYFKALAMGTIKSYLVAIHFHQIALLDPNIGNWSTLLRDIAGFPDVDCLSLVFLLGKTDIQYILHYFANS